MDTGSFKSRGQWWARAPRGRGPTPGQGKHHACRPDQIRGSGSGGGRPPLISFFFPRPPSPLLLAGLSLAHPWGEVVWRGATATAESPTYQRPRPRPLLS